MSGEEAYVTPQIQITTWWVALCISFGIIAAIVMSAVALGYAVKNQNSNCITTTIVSETPSDNVNTENRYDTNLDTVNQKIDQITHQTRLDRGVVFVSIDYSDDPLEMSLSVDDIDKPSIVMVPHVDVPNHMTRHETDITELVTHTSAAQKVVQRNFLRTNGSVFCSDVHSLVSINVNLSVEVEAIYTNEIGLQIGVVDVVTGKFVSTHDVYVSTDVSVSDLSIPFYAFPMIEDRLYTIGVVALTEDVGVRVRSAEFVVHVLDSGSS